MTFIAGPKGKPATKRDVAKLGKISAAQQHELRRQARAIGALLSAEPPEAFRSRVKAYWRIRKTMAGELNAPLPLEAVS